MFYYIFLLLFIGYRLYSDRQNVPFMNLSRWDSRKENFAFSALISWIYFLLFEHDLCMDKPVLQCKGEIRVPLVHCAQKVEVFFFKIFHTAFMVYSLAKKYGKFAIFVVCYKNLINFVCFIRHLFLCLCWLKVCHNYFPYIFSPWSTKNKNGKRHPCWCKPPFYCQTALW